VKRVLGHQLCSPAKVMALIEAAKFEAIEAYKKVGLFY
jgi:hypothetical protein